MDKALIYFEEVYQAYQRAAQEQKVFYLRIGDNVLRLCFAGDAMVDQMLPALEHLCISEECADPSLTVCFWDTASTGVTLPRAPWQSRSDDIDAYGVVREFNTERIYTIQQQKRVDGVDLLKVYDVERQLAIVHSPDARQIPYWMRSFPLRVILHCWTLSRQAQLVHAGAVGTPKGGVLLAGRGGSGKSTTVLACLGSELKYAGDDYVMVGLDRPPTVYSLYNTAKINPDNLFRLPHLREMISNPNRLSSEKALYFLNPHVPDHLIRDFPLKAIVLPHITGEADSCLTPATPIQVLTELAPTTTLQLRTAQKVTFQRLSQLARMVPLYTLELGTDLSQIAPLLLSLSKG